MSGNFSVIIKSSGSVFAAVDICRSQPIFYNGSTFETLDLVDSLPTEKIRQQVISKENVLEFYELGFITGNKTLADDYYQLQAGEYLYADDSTFLIETYFSYNPSKTPVLISDIQVFVKAFDRLLTHVFEHLVELFPEDSEWVVPLSGGHDSRLIVNYLYKAGVKNVTCYTYGEPGNRQSEISKMVADAAGYRWHFIEYTEEKWHQLHQNSTIDKYFDYSFNGVSTPHLQDLLAVYELKQNNIISDKAVFLPGHSSITEYGFKNDNSVVTMEEAIVQLASELYTKDFSVSAENRLQHISRVSRDPKFVNANFNWRETQSKIVVNSLRVYDFFDYDYAVPFWFSDVAKFWLDIPYKHLVGRTILYEAEKSGLIEPLFYSIPYANPDIKNSSALKELVKKFIPKKIISFLLNRSKLKSGSAEALNLAFAKRGSDIRDILQPIEKFPAEVQNDLKLYLERRPYQISAANMSKFYTLKKLLE
jgi:asparagine synthase (glutamine-hydrolysing)